MIIELGHFCLILGACTSLFQVVSPLLWKSDSEISNIFSSRSAQLTFFFIFMAFLSLTYAYIVSDFSVLNVFENSHTRKPLFYKIAGVWGNHEGSMLLWILILSLYGMLFSYQKIESPFKNKTLCVQGALTLAFLFFLLFTSNPFLRVFPPPINGQDLNALLQDPLLIIHPPILYVGYVGFSLVFSYVVAILWQNDFFSAWSQNLHKWIMAPWTFLTAGIILGSIWAYYELGWGGWWFWDPVENASLMPWLAATALIHANMALKKKKVFLRWTLFLALLTFSLSLTGTFLVRSGLMTSVHSFASDPDRGLFILMIMSVFIGASFILLVWRGYSLPQTSDHYTLFSRESFISFQNIILFVCVFTILLGTLYPLFIEGLFGEVITVGEAYYQKTFVYFMIPFIFLMGLAPLLKWHQTKIQKIWPQIGFTFCAAAAIGFIITYTMVPYFWSGFIGFSLSAWLIITSFVYFFRPLFQQNKTINILLLFKRPLTTYSTFFAHLGIAIAVMGMVASSLWKTESLIELELNKQKLVNGYHILLQDIHERKEENYISLQAELLISKFGKKIAIFKPERRYYQISAVTTTETSIHSYNLTDLYVTLHNITEKDKILEKLEIKILFEPYVKLIWFGFGLIIFAGLISLCKRNKFYI